MGTHRLPVSALAALLLMVPGSAVAQDESPSAASPAPDSQGMLAESEFAGVFPTELGGLPWEQVTISIGAQNIEDSGDEEVAQFQRLVEALGATIEDVSTANASRFDADLTEFSIVSAFKVAGVDAQRLFEALLPEFVADLEEPVLEDGQVAGKDVVIAYDATTEGFFGEAQPLYLYASGDIVWIVSAAEPLLTEAFEKLP